MADQDDYPFADTMAQRLLAQGLQLVMARKGISLRQLGKELGYKQAVVLSHMASGRVPIPIDRAPILAEALEIDPRIFLAAVVQQRHPEVDWSLMKAGSGEDATFALATELTGGRPFEELNPGQRRVIREAAADSRAQSRWLTPHEVATVNLLRELRPGIAEHGLGTGDREALRAALGQT
jgi:transcriptional regulator with XRE-family HTH domain